MDVRQELIAKKQEWIELRRREGVEGFFRATALALPMPPSIQDALLVPRAERAVVPHICRTLLEERGGDAGTIAELVKALTEEGASAFLISTGLPMDGTGFEDVLAAAQNTHVPVICRDVFLDPLQITLARAHGAAAIVLCAQLLDDRSLRHLRRAAEDLSLDTVLDVSSVRHIEAASRGRQGQGAGEFRIYGADLLCLSAAQAGRFRDRLADALPEHALAIAALGEDNIDDVEALTQAGYSAFVVDVSYPDLHLARARVRATAGATSALN